MAFFGHVSGDEFVIIIPADKRSAVADEIIRRIGTGTLDIYSAEDLKWGYVVSADRGRE